MKTDYCTQNEGDCLSCALVNYGRDCANNRVYILADLAETVTGGKLAVMAKLLNDAGMDPRLDELQPSPGAHVPRPAMIDLAATRAGDRVGRKLAELLES